LRTKNRSVFWIVENCQMVSGELALYPCRYSGLARRSDKRYGCGRLQEQGSGRRMIYIVLPAYNEENSLGALLARIRASLDTFPGGYEVIIVNDGSADQTLTIARQQSMVMSVQIVDHGYNRGLGEALKSGLRAASEKAQLQDVIVTMDADNTHSPD